MATRKTAPPAPPEPITLMKPRESASGQFPMIDPETKEQMVDVVRQPDGSTKERLLWEPWVIKPSELYPADHPIVQGWPHLFVPAGPTAPGYAPLEVVS